MKKTLIYPIALLFITIQTFALDTPRPEEISLFNRKVGDISLYDRLKSQGIPEEALTRSFTFLDANAGKKIVVDHKVRPTDNQPPYMSQVTVEVKRQFAALADFTLPSTQKRLYLLNLTTGEVEKFYVSHGRNSGSLYATEFSNVNMSKKTSVGIMIAGDTYIGKHGRSLNLYGLEPSNSLSAERDIVMHGADYVSEDFIQAHGRLGLSWGCPAVEKRVLEKLISALSNGSLLYHYFPSWPQAPK